MTIQDKQTIKSYFESGDVPTQAQFAILIDSLLGIQEEIADNLTTDSDVQALSARQGVALKTIVDAMGLRVSSIEELNTTTLQDYLLKADLGGYLAGKAELAHTHLAANITDLLDIVYTQAQVNELIANYSVESHGHDISDVTGLQSALDNANDTSLIASTRSDLEAQISGKSSTGHAHTESDITDLKNYIESATAIVLLQSKAEVSHTHSEDQITDLDKYSKAEVDSLFAGVVTDGTVPAHTHTEADITDLDKYKKTEVDQKIEDSKQTFLTSHLAEDNPHGIDKNDVGLGNVENLSKASLFDNVTLTGDITFDGNITGITKTDLGLGSVPNSNVLDLLNAHLADTGNPHKVNLNDFDAFSRAQTEAKIQELIEIFRTVHIGDLPQVGTGSTGLVTQLDIWSRIQSINFTSPNMTISANVTVDGTLKVQDAISDTNGDLVLKGFTDGGTVYKVHIDDSLLVSNDTTIGGAGTGEGANLTVYGSIKPNNTVKALTADLNLEGADNFKVKVNDALDVAGNLTTQNNITATNGDLVLSGKTSATNKVQVNDPFDVVGASTFSGTTIGTTQNKANLTVNGNATVSGDLTVNGTTTSIDTTHLEIEDNVVVLNKNQTGTPASTLQSGIEVERGDASNAKLYFDEGTGKWKAQIVVNGTILTKTIAFEEDVYAQG